MYTIVLELSLLAKKCDFIISQKIIYQKVFIISFTLRMFTHVSERIPKRDRYSQVHQKLISEDYAFAKCFRKNI